MSAPGVIHFRRQLITDLADGYSVICLTSEGDPIGLLSQLQADLRASDYNYSIIDPNYNAQDDDWPVDVLRRQLDLPAAGSPVYNLQQFMLEMALPELIVVIGLDQLGPARRRWMQFFANWAQAAHSIASTSGRQPSRILTAFCPDDSDELPPEETRMRRYWEWSLPSAIEMTLLCRMRAVQESETIGPRALWREATLPVLAGNDPALLSFLWDDVYKEFDHLLDRLGQYAAARNWTLQTLRTWGIDEFVRRQSSPREPERLDQVGRRLWARGVLGNTPEYGPLLSSAALAVMGEIESIRHRLWRGQATLTLPLVDQMRLHACRQLATRSQAVSGGDYMEWSPLLDALRARHDPYLYRLRQYVEQARNARNTLAHYKLIRYDDYAQLAGFLR